MQSPAPLPPSLARSLDFQLSELPQFSSPPSPALPSLASQRFSPSESPLPDAQNSSPESIQVRNSPPSKSFSVGPLNFSEAPAQKKRPPVPAMTGIFNQQNARAPTAAAPASVRAFPVVSSSPARPANFPPLDVPRPENPHRRSPPHEPREKQEKSKTNSSSGEKPRRISQPGSSIPVKNSSASPRWRDGVFYYPIAMPGAPADLPSLLFTVGAAKPLGERIPREKRSAAQDSEDVDDGQLSESEDFPQQRKRRRREEKKQEELEDLDEADDPVDAEDSDVSSVALSDSAENSSFQSRGTVEIFKGVRLYISPEGKSFASAVDMTRMIKQRGGQPPCLFRSQVNYRAGERIHVRLDARHRNQLETELSKNGSGIPLVFIATSALARWIKKRLRRTTKYTETKEFQLIHQKILPKMREIDQKKKARKS